VGEAVGARSSRKTGELAGRRRGRARRWRHERPARRGTHDVPPIARSVRPTGILYLGTVGGNGRAHADPEHEAAARIAADPAYAERAQAFARRIEHEDGAAAVLATVDDLLS
jgi:hypothetical protein